MTNASGLSPWYVLESAIGPACSHAGSIPVAAVQDLVVVEDDWLAKAVLSNVGDQVVELGAFDEGEGFGKRVKRDHSFLTSTCRAEALHLSLALLLPDCDNCVGLIRQRLAAILWSLEIAGSQMTISFTLGGDLWNG